MKYFTQLFVKLELKLMSQWRNGLNLSCEGWPREGVMLYPLQFKSIGLKTRWDEPLKNEKILHSNETLNLCPEPTVCKLGWGKPLVSPSLIPSYHKMNSRHKSMKAMLIHWYKDSKQDFPSLQVLSKIDFYLSHIWFMRQTVLISKIWTNRL